MRHRGIRVNWNCIHLSLSLASAARHSPDSRLSSLPLWSSDLVAGVRTLLPELHATSRHRIHDWILVGGGLPSWLAPGLWAPGDDHPGPSERIGCVAPTHLQFRELHICLKPLQSPYIADIHPADAHWGTRPNGTIDSQHPMMP